MAIIDELGAEIIAINAANGFPPSDPSWWDDKHKIPAHLALIHSEVSEALEAFREGDIENFGEELADVAIRLLSFASGLDIDLGTKIFEKMAANRERAFRHGGKVI